MEKDSVGKGQVCSNYWLSSGDLYLSPTGGKWMLEAGNEGVLSHEDL